MYNFHKNINGTYLHMCHLYRKGLADVFQTFDEDLEKVDRQEIRELLGVALKD